MNGLERCLQRRSPIKVWVALLPTVEPQGHLQGGVVRLANERVADWGWDGLKGSGRRTVIVISASGRSNGW